MAFHDPSPYANIEGTGDLYLVLSKVEPEIEVDGELTDEVRLATIQESRENAVKRFVWHTEQALGTNVVDDEIYITEYDGGDLEAQDFEHVTEEIDFSEVR